MTHRIKQISCALTCLALFGFGNLPAQASQAPTRVPVLVAITSEPAFSHSPFMVLRRAGGGSGDIIVLKEGSADGAQLSTAVRVLLAARRADGDTAGVAQAFSGEVKTARGQAAQPLPWAQRVVEDAARAHSRFIPGVGSARTIEIWLPPQRGKSSSQTH